MELSLIGVYYKKRPARKYASPTFLFVLIFLFFIRQIQSNIPRCEETLIIGFGENDDVFGEFFG